MSNEPSSALHSSKPDPLVAVRYERTISSQLFFLTLNSALFLVVGALATRYHTTLYIGVLASILSIFLCATLLLLHKVLDTSKPKGPSTSTAGGDAEGQGGEDGSGVVKGNTEASGRWRDRLNQNLWDGVYPPNQKMPSVLGMTLVFILWGISTCITIEYHVLIGKGEKPSIEIRQGPLSSYGELSFSCLCTIFSFVLLVMMLTQRRQTSKEMVKAICSDELEY